MVDSVVGRQDKADRIAWSSLSGKWRWWAGVVKASRGHGSRSVAQGRAAVGGVLCGGGLSSR